MCPGYTVFTSDFKVIEVNLKGVVQIIYQNKLSGKSFVISLDMKAKSSISPVKTMVHRLKITDLGDHLSRMIFF